MGCCWKWNPYVLSPVSLRGSTVIKIHDMMSLRISPYPYSTCGSQSGKSGARTGPSPFKGQGEKQDITELAKKKNDKRERTSSYCPGIHAAQWAGKPLPISRIPRGCLFHFALTTWNDSEGKGRGHLRTQLVEAPAKHSVFPLPWNAMALMNHQAFLTLDLFLSPVSVHLVSPEWAGSWGMGSPEFLDFPLLEIQWASWSFVY